MAIETVFEVTCDVKGCKAPKLVVKGTTQPMHVAMEYGWSQGSKGEVLCPDHRDKKCSCGGRIDYDETLDGFHESGRKLAKAYCNDCDKKYWADPKNEQFLKVRKE